jgi:membrane protein involved in colicin uptake
MQDERNAAVNSVAAAIASNEDLKISNRELQDQLEQLRVEKQEAEIYSRRQREEWKSREEKLRRRTQEALEAAAAAETAIKEKQKREQEAFEAAERNAAAKRHEERIRQQEAEHQAELQRIEREKHERRKAESKKEFDRKVMERLQQTRPDFFINRSEPIVIPSGTTPAKSKATVNVDGKNRVIALPKSRKTRKNVEVEEVSDFDITQVPVPSKKGKEKDTTGKDAETIRAVLEAAGGMDDTVTAVSVSDRVFVKRLNC